MCHVSMAWQESLDSKTVSTLGTDIVCLSSVMNIRLIEPLQPLTLFLNVFVHSQLSELMQHLIFFLPTELHSLL